jgi:hypothetical protein
MKNKILILFLIAAASMATAQYVIPLAEPVELQAPVVEEIELVSVRIFPGQKRLEVTAKAGGHTITAVRKGADYDAIIAQIDVALLTQLFIADLESAVQALAAPAPSQP